ncbi:MAG: hypothetical protein DME65_03415 [Verrucomicrobia bacterium]|nr:MAG: hypothetical protein DME65_03415 [Verrucomicrobiota bacterium]
MNDQQTLDKSRSGWRLQRKDSTNMNNHSTYALLVRSQEKGRGIMETAVYFTCILSVVIAIFQFAGQPTPEPFAGFESPAQPRPVLSHHAVETVLDTKS